MITEMVKNHSAFITELLAKALSEPDIDLEETRSDYEIAMQAGLDGWPMVLTHGLTPFRIYIMTRAYEHGAKHLKEMDDGK